MELARVPKEHIVHVSGSAASCSCGASVGFAPWNNENRDSVRRWAEGHIEAWNSKDA